jgi:hypothetical protein
MDLESASDSVKALVLKSDWVSGSESGSGSKLIPD